TVTSLRWLEPRLARTLTDTDGTFLPHLTLAQTMDSEDVRILPESPYDKMLHPNTFHRSLLVPEQLVWSESGTVLSPDFTNEAWVSVSYYRVRLPRTAPILLSGLTAEYRQELSAFQQQQDDLVVHTTFTINQEFQPVFRSDFDQLLLLEYRTDNDPVTQCYVGRIGAQVFRLVCRGIPDPDRCLALLAGQMR
ncbi:MAG: hypothetical protein VB071_08915, partial [Lawsonibacter sp.]|nr:hypothetical protein [Lawsonibacter sp.]